MDKAWLLQRACSVGVVALVAHEGIQAALVECDVKGAICKLPRPQTAAQIHRPSALWKSQVTTVTWLITSNSIFSWATILDNWMTYDCLDEAYLHRSHVHDLPPHARALPQVLAHHVAHHRRHEVDVRDVLQPVVVPDVERVCLEISKEAPA